MSGAPKSGGEPSTLFESHHYHKVLFQLWLHGVAFPPRARLQLYFQPLLQDLRSIFSTAVHSEHLDNNNKKNDKYTRIYDSSSTHPRIKTKHAPASYKYSAITWDVQQETRQLPQFYSLLQPPSPLLFLFFSSRAYTIPHHKMKQFLGLIWNTSREAALYNRLKCHL